MKKGILILIILSLILISGCISKENIDNKKLNTYQQEIEKDNIMLNKEQYLSGDESYSKNSYIFNILNGNNDPSELTYVERTELYNICNNLIRETVLKEIGSNCGEKVPEFTYKEVYHHYNDVRYTDKMSFEFCNKENDPIKIHYTIEEEVEVQDESGTRKQMMDMEDEYTISANECEGYKYGWGEMGSMKIKNVYADSVYTCSLPSFNNKQKLVSKYFILQCMHNYPIYGSKVKEMINDAGNKPQEVSLLMEGMVSFREIFPLNIEMPDFSLGKSEINFAKPNWCGDQVCDLDEDSRWCDDCKGTRLIIPTSKEYYTCYDKAIKDESAILHIDLCKNYLELIGENIESSQESNNIQKSDYIINNGEQKILQNTVVEFKEESNNIEVYTQKPIEKVYDFPYLKMNKEDIILQTNYDTIAKEILIDYSAIGVIIDSDKYTIVIQNGKIVRIDNRLNDNLDFTIQTTKSKIIDLNKMAIKGDKKGLILSGLDLIPMKVKLNLITKLNKLLK